MAARATALGRLARRVGFPLFYAASVLIGLELCVRLFMPQVLPRDAPEIYVPDDEIGWRHAVGTHTVVNTGERDVQVCIDAAGNRISCSDPGPSLCTRRVLIVGDSFVEALALPFEQTVWYRLQKDTGACVDSAGVGAYGPGQYLKLVRERLRAVPGRYQLVVLSFYSGNDFTSEAEHVPPARDVWRRPFRLLPAGFTRQDLNDWFYPLNQRLENVSHAYVALRFALRRFMDPGDAGIYGVANALRESHMTAEVIGETTRAIELIAADTRRAGIPLIVTVVPIRNQITDPQGEALRAGIPGLADDIRMDLVESRFLPRLRAIPGVEVVEVLPALQADASRANWEERDGHFSAQGHEVWFATLRTPVRRALGLD